MNQSDINNKPTKIKRGRPSDVWLFLATASRLAGRLARSLEFKNIGVWQR